MKPRCVDLAAKTMTRMKRCAAACFISALLASPHMALAASCDQQSLQANLKEVERNLAKPSVQKQIDAAKADYAADQDFDDIDAALYLDAYALYLDIRNNASAGKIDAACAKYDEVATMFELLQAAE